MSFSTESVPVVTLRDGAKIPQMGFGVFQVPPEDTAAVVDKALATGYRHIDTAAAYENEAAVGQALHASGLDRGDVFITTKCSNDDHGYEQATRALRASLSRASRSAGSGPSAVAANMRRGYGRDRPL